MSKSTYYHIILDASGSMQDSITPTLSGYNEQLQVLASLQKRFPEQMIRVGLTLFNETVTPAFFALPTERMKPMDRVLYQPDGGTALLDAIGTSVLKLQDAFGREIEKGDATVVVVILTDGYENASTLFTHRGISKLIADLEKSRKWTFTYLGATPDAVSVATALNIKEENSMAFTKDEMHASYTTLSDSMEMYMEQKETGAPLRQFLKKGRG